MVLDIALPSQRGAFVLVWFLGKQFPILNSRLEIWAMTPLLLCFDDFLQLLHMNSRIKVYFIVQSQHCDSVPISASF